MMPDWQARRRPVASDELRIPDEAGQGRGAEADDGDRGRLIQVARLEHDLLC